MKGKNITFNELPEAIEAIMTAQAQILDALKNQSPTVQPEKELLTTKEAAELLDINRTTLWKWEKEGKVKSYGIESRKYFKRSEILAALTPLN